MKRKSQISLEYLIILGFVLVVIIGILGIAFFYSGSIQDRIKLTQISNFANKITSTSESVFYYGEPSKSTISVYLPEGVREIKITGNYIYITTQVSTGLEKNSFYSNVPITGIISIISGIKKIEISAGQNLTRINSL